MKFCNFFRWPTPKAGVILMGLLVMLSFTARVAGDEGEERLRAGQKKCTEQRYEEALDIFQQLVYDSATAAYRDDAQFWIGYCLENIPDRRTEAFVTFGELIARYPHSPWWDDALVHQILLAEQFAKEGKNQFRHFIEEKWRTEQGEIKIQAASALARLGQKEVLPFLQQLQLEPAEQEKIGRLINRLQKDTLVISTPLEERDLRLTYDARKLQPDREQQVKKFNFLGLGSRRYDQYHSMLRTDDNWTREELNDFALWQIIDSDQFEEYRNLASDYDRQEWLRKFWKRKDPTPTTEKNEFKEEFDRRVEYARSQFSQFWNYTYFKYLPDQHLRFGWEHAPWDARGELYIKYGEPDARSVYGWHLEEWTYFRYDVDFIVKQYMTNIYGNALAAGPMTQRMHRNFEGYNPYTKTSELSQMFDEEWAIHMNWNAYLDQEFLFNPEIRYQYDYGANLLKGFQLTSQMHRNPDSIGIKINYRIPLKEFALKTEKPRADLPREYQESLVILDDDLRVVKAEDTLRPVVGTVGKAEFLQQEINISIPNDRAILPGYILYISIYDSLTKKLGIYEHDLMGN